MCVILAAVSAFFKSVFDFNAGFSGNLAVMAVDGSCPVMSRIMDDADDDESPYDRGLIAEDDPDVSELQTDEELDWDDNCDG